MKILLSYILYYAGDLISRPMNRFDWGWLYPLYNRLMLWSVSLQGKANKGPWTWHQ